MSFNPLNMINNLTGGKLYNNDGEVPEAREAENATYGGDNPYIAPQPKAAEPAHVKYTIKQGDTLIKIAYINNISERSILQMNGLHDNMSVFPGQVIKLPIKAPSKVKAVK